LGIPASAQGSVTFKNLSEPYERFALELEPVRASGSVEPVCRMWIERTKATGPRRYAGVDYWFCSANCAERFAAAPGRYTD